MSDAPESWKVACLRKIKTMPPTTAFDDKTTPPQSLLWLQDLARDGYIDAQFRMGANNIPNLIWDVHVLDKGRQFIEDFESQRTVSGKWKKYHLRLFDWIMGVIAGAIGAYLVHHFGFK